MAQVDEDGKEAVEHLMRYPPESWSRAYFDTTCKNYSVDNNLTESFNSWIKEARFKPIVKMLEEIRVKVMNMLREHESDVMSWSNDFSPQTMQLYNQYLKIAQKCHVHSNGQDGYEVSEDGDRHTVNMITKRCTCRTWDLNGIPCPHAIKAMQHNKVDPVTEIHWWYSKEAYLLLYSHKLQPVRGEKFWKVEASHAMEPPVMTSMAGRPKVKRTREKNETVNRQGEWMQSRKGRIMKCSTCGQPGHNSRGCAKNSKGKQPMGSKKKGKQAKRQRCNATEDSNDEPPMSPVASNVPTEEDIELSVPLYSQPSQASQFHFMPTPTVQRKPINNTMPPDFQSDSASEIRPRSFSEESTRLLMRQQGSIPPITRTINFVGDSSSMRNMAVRRKGNGKSQK